MATNELNGQDDLSNAPASEVSEIPDSAMQAITEKMSDVFGKADDKDRSEMGLSGGKTTPKDTKDVELDAREQRRQSVVKKEQQEDLEDEGLTDPNSPEGIDPKAEKNIAEAKVETDKAKVEAAGAAPETPALDPTLRLAANQLGWSDEKIDKFLKADAELAQETFENLADTYTNLSRQLIGGNASQVAPGTQPQITTAQPQVEASPLDKLLSPAALATFAETNGQEIVDLFLKPFAAERKALTDQVKELTAFVEVSQRRAVAQEAGGVMSGLAKTFGDLYGVDTTKLSLVQQQARQNLANVADQIRAGAKQQGHELSVTEAINRAHLIVSADHRQQVSRKQVTEQVRSRSKQITAKPSQRSNPTLTGVKSDTTAAEAYQRRAAELGIEIG